MTSATRRMRARVENRRSAQKYRNSFAGKQTVINANAVAPGIIETDVTIGKFGDDWEQQLKSTIPSGRFGAPAEVAQVVVFLASAMASYVNGAVIDVNGGIYMH